MSTEPQSELGAGKDYTVRSKDAASVPQSIGKYRIERKLGAGGMGTVYLATDIQLRRRVALKVLPRERAENPTMVKRFRAEAQAAANLKHKNIVSVYETGQADGYIYIAMEFVDGIDVHDLVYRREVIPVKRSINMIKQVARALQHAHDKGIVHRDIKPSNLLIQRDGTVKLADLGLARSLDDASDAGITRDGTTVGTVDYMSPEQARNSRKADTRSDIYSLGCTWYHMLTGEPPYPDGSLTNRLRLHAQGKIPDPRDINPAVPAGVVAILYRMTAKDPNERYATPTEFLEELENANLQRDTATGGVLAALDTATQTAFEERVTPKSEASTMPSRNPRLGPDKSSASFVIPYSLIGIVLTGIAVLGFAVYGFIQWGPRGDENTATITNPVGTANPFAGGDDAPKQQTDQGNSGRKAKNPDKKKTVAVPKKEGGNPGSGHPKTNISSQDAYVKYVPRWASVAIQRLTESGKPAVTLEGAKSGAPQISLKEAIEGLPAEGGVIELRGTGPYFLQPVRVKGRGRILITGAGESRPLVALRQPTGDQSAILDVENGSLELQGIDFVVLQNQTEASEQYAAVRVNRGDLTVRDCSLITHGSPHSPVTGFRVERGKALSGQTVKHSTQVLITQTAVLGPRLTAVSVNAELADVVFRESLFYAGGAPALQFSRSDQTAEQPGHDVRMIASTIISEQIAVDLSGHGLKDATIPTRMTVVGSLFASNGNSGSAALLSLNKRSRTDGKFDHLSWTSINSAYQGWPSLITERTVNGEAILAADYDAWRTFWREPGEKTRFDRLPWPSAIPSRTEVVALAPFSPETLPNKQAGTPGCRTEILHLGDISLLTSSEERPEPPQRHQWVKAEFKAARRIPLDLTKIDLGRFILKENLPDRAVIVATGFGLRRITPFVVKQKSLRIEFKQKPGEAPLELAPKISRRKSTRSKTKNRNALITLLGGRLQLVNGNFKLPSAQNNTNPNWLLDVVGGEFSLEHCHMVAQPAGNSRKKGIVLWRLAPDGPTKALRKNYLSSEIRDSFLAGGGTLIAANLKRQLLFVDNTILAAKDDLFGMDIRNAGADIDSAVVLKKCTCSAIGTLFNIVSSELPAAAKSPLRIFSEECIFAAPMKTGQTKVSPIMMTTGKAAIAQRQITWIGKSNGFADEIKVFLAPSQQEHAKEQLFQIAWRDVWGKNNVLSPLTEPGGVLLAKPLPALRELTPNHFALQQSVKARQWGENDRPIGATVGQIDFAKSPRGPSPKPNKKGRTPKKKKKKSSKSKGF